MRLFKNTISNLKHGFTLSEVLITLVIIGIVAALTIPTAINKYRKQELVTKLKKAYSTLYQGTNRIIAEDGNVTVWLNNIDAAYSRYLKYLSVARACGSGTGCFPQKNGTGTYKTLNNQNYNHNWDTDSSARKFVLADGIQVFLGGAGFSTQCQTGGDTCIRILVDTNGVKAPNQWGRDVFEFRLKNGGLYPHGCDITLDSYDGTKYTCKVLRENAMNY